MHVLVTGGAGFIGSHLTEALIREGHTVRVLDDLSTGSLDHLSAVRNRIEFLQGSIVDQPTVRRAVEGVSHIIHLAAMRSIPRSMDDPVGCNRINVEGTLNVLVAARDAKVRRVVFASSSSVYGDAPSFPARETDLTQPTSPYAISKLAGELYAQVFRDALGLDVICLRYFNVFGPRMDAESGYAMAVPRFIACMLRDEPPPVFGDGLQTRDFTHVDNVVRATIQALQLSHPKAGVFNVGCGHDYSILDLVNTLNRLLGKQISPQHLPAKPGEARRTLADVTQAKTLLGFEPLIDFSTGLAQTIEWFRRRQGSSVPSAARTPP